MASLSIGDVALMTGVAEGTLRMWERRYGFPHPERLESGHRRYGPEQVELVRRVAAARAAGTSLSVAIERATRQAERGTASLFASLREQHPELQAMTLTESAMLALSHAIEDESIARAGEPVLFASFQRPGFYSHQRRRWRELSRGAALAVVFAEFPRPRTPRNGPIEVAVEPGRPLAREWAVVCDAERYAICLVGREPPFSSAGTPSARRAFETVWSVDPAVVRDAARICARMLPELPSAVIGAGTERLEGEPVVLASDQLRLAAALTSRTLAYLAPARRRRRRPPGPSPGRRSLA